VDWSRGQGFGFSRIVSLGNQADVNETDILSMLADDEHTKVIVMYMESVSDGRRFVQVASEVTRRKPVIAMKVGRFESGQKAAASHTGALAASDIAFDAAFEKAGILRADTTEQMFDWAQALVAFALSGVAHVATQSKGRIAILTNAGGPGVIAADSLEHHGLTLAKLREPTLKSLIATLPAAASVFNPVDMLASASPEQYALCLKVLLEDSNVDGALVILPPPPMFKAEAVAEKLIEAIRQFDKPVVIALMGSTLIQKASETFQLSNIPTYEFPERAASALSAVFKRAEYLDDRPLTIDHIVHHPSSNIEELLTTYGIPTIPLKLARDETKRLILQMDSAIPS
jgi:acetate---CoA ligase (ADP-forming)